MSEKSQNRIIELRNEIYKDIYDQNRWVYVKIQSLLENINKHYISITDYYEYIEQLSNMERTNLIADKLNIDYKIINIFRIINNYANKLKHDYNIYIINNIRYDQVLIDKFIIYYNRYCEYLFGKKWMMYQLENLTTNNSNYYKIHTFRENNKIVTKSIERNKNIQKNLVRIYTGIGKHDNGFVINNIICENQCNSLNASIFAVIYNFLQRSKKIKKSVFIRNIESEQRILRDYRNIYRYEIILLVMIRNNYFSEEEINVTTIDGDRRELEIAIEEINWYGYNISLLMNVDFKPLTFVKSDSVYTISINGCHAADVYSIDIVEEQDDVKEFWYENAINYKAVCTEKVIECLKNFLLDFFGCKTFKPGQLEALTLLLNGNENFITILPTGGGKSLLYYFVALLQPKQTLVISPTEILIKDQIRNLQELHNIDDTYCFVNENVNINYVKSNKSIIDCGNLLVFITPENLQHRNVIMPLISQNTENKFANIVLDEIHTISDWSHDFRPDYLMLSFNLLEHLDNARYLGFTATANFRVLKDIISQLGISSNCIISPIDMRRNNIDFTFIPCDKEKNLLEAYHNQIISKYEKINLAQKTMVFTKGRLVSQSIKDTSSDYLKWNIDIFSSEDIYSYTGFIKGRKSILICEEEMGVGINVPMVRNVIHYGTPISKSQYVQEIGRVDRFGEGGESIVLFKPRVNMNRYESIVLDFNSTIDEILSALNMLEDDNDIKLTFAKILGHITHYSKMATGIYELFRRLTDIENYLRLSINNHDTFDIFTQQVYMYFLFKMGVIHNWYLVEKNNEYVTYDIEVSENHTKLVSIKQSSINYITALGYKNDATYAIEEAKTIKEIIYLVQSWYYNQFLKYHREQLLNIIDFFEVNLNQKISKNEVVAQLSDYFSNSLVSNGGNEKDYVMSLTIRETIETIEKEPNSLLISKIERVLENEYSSKLDLYICIHQIVVSSHVNTSRLRRALSEIDNSTLFDFIENLYLLYLKLKNDFDRLEFVKCLSEKSDYNYIMENLFMKVSKDKLYYAYLAECLNKEIVKIKRG
ncbi:MAG: DEAD/DEAH box helicase [Clostridia bacterium]|nr:DEAD/DEAH box helicase [Clostridia bacterium]